MLYLCFGYDVMDNVVLMKIWIDSTPMIYEMSYVNSILQQLIILMHSRLVSFCITNCILFLTVIKK